jgi:hypothetical protein
VLIPGDVAFFTNVIVCAGSKSVDDCLCDANLYKGEGELTCSACPDFSTSAEGIHQESHALFDVCVYIACAQGGDLLESESFWV